MKRYYLTFNDEEIEHIKKILNKTECDLTSFDIKTIILSNFDKFCLKKSIVDNFIKKLDVAQTFSLKDIYFGFDLSRSEQSELGKYISNLPNISVYKNNQGVHEYIKEY